MRKLKMSTDWQFESIWRGFAQHWQCFPVSAALQCNKSFLLLDISLLPSLSRTVAKWSVENMLFGALALCVICHEVSSPSGFVLFGDWILRLKVVKRRLFEESVLGALFCYLNHCVIPGNINTSPMEGILPPTPLEIPITCKLHTFL